MRVGGANKIASIQGDLEERLNSNILMIRKNLNLESQCIGYS